MKFILTKELGRLAKWLRILGYDTEYFTQGKPGSLIVQALQDTRIILTRNHRLPQPRGIKIIIIKSEHIKAQLAEALKVLNIAPNTDKMFTRCILCNAVLTPVNKEKIKEKVPEYVFATQQNFIACPECNRVYWQGTHWGNVQGILKEIKWNS